MGKEGLCARGGTFAMGQHPGGVYSKLIKAMVTEASHPLNAKQNLHRYRLFND
jgi:hypothetical protein